MLADPEGVAAVKALVVTLSVYTVLWALYEVLTGTSSAHDRCGHCGARKVADAREFCMRCSDG